MDLKKIKAIYGKSKTSFRFYYLLKKLRVLGPNPKIFEKKIIFIHIPKAAGTSISRLDVGYTFGHQNYEFYEKWLPASKPMPPTFCVVRNPYDRYISSFRYLHENRGNWIDQAWARKNRIHEKSVNEFAEECLSSPEVLNWMHFKPQICYVKNKAGRIAVDHILKFEDLSRNWPEFAQRYRLEGVLSTRNVATKSNDYLLSDLAQKAVQSVYSDDFEAFGYDK